MSNPIRVVGAVFHDGNRFLACRKKPGKPLEGHWEFPGGEVEPGETLSPSSGNTRRTQPQSRGGSQGCNNNLRVRIRDH